MPSGRTSIDEPTRRRRDAELLAVVDRDYRAAARASGDQLACAPGCSDCCSGPIPITRLDAWRLRRGLVRLTAEAPPVARRIVARSTDCVERLRAGYPGDPDTGLLDGDEVALDGFLVGHGDLECPVLHPETGRCELYEWRPVSCRTYGPPLRFGDVESPHCRLCFGDSDAATIERCRYEPDRDGLEQALLGSIGVAPGADWETLIAFVLADEAVPGDRTGA